MKPSDILIKKKGSSEDFYKYGLYLLRFKKKVYIGCAFDETIDARLKAHRNNSITGTTPKDRQLREEGECTAEVLYFLNRNLSRNRRKKLIMLIEDYLIYKCGHNILEQLLDVDILDETLVKYKDIISAYMLNSQY